MQVEELITHLQSFCRRAPEREKGSVRVVTDDGVFNVTGFGFDMEDNLVLRIDVVNINNSTLYTKE